MAVRRDVRLLKQLGHRVGELRAMRGLTQEQFAEVLGLSTRYVQTVESGSENLTVLTLSLLAKKLGVGIADLLEKPQTPRPKRGRPKATTVADDDTPKTPRPRASRAQGAPSSPSRRRRTTPDR